MKTLCVIADTHRKHREITIPPCDFLIHCGDFCNFQEQDERTLQDADCWFAEAPATHVICIGGNHDFLLHSREFTFAHASFLQDRLVEIDGLSFYGSPWCPELAAFAYYATSDQLQERWRAIPSGIDVLITHTPPQGILDLPSSRTPHLGCPQLREELKRIKPRIHVFGHIHASHGSHTEDGILFLNAAMVSGRDYSVRSNPYLTNLLPPK
jgi:Icc-related predicted phosphoesterase